MAEQPVVTRRDVEARLVARAWKDEAFADELRRDPKAALRRELEKLGVPAALPDGLEVRVLEETPTTLYLVIPHRPRGAALSDADLEHAAGGTVPPARPTSDHDPACLARSWTHKNPPRGIPVCPNPT